MGLRDLNIVRTVAIEVLKASGEMLLKIAATDRSYTQKGELDILAKADVASESLILGRIREAFPEDSILSEEAGSNDGVSEYRWILDPIDGTINYVRGFDEYALSLALEHNGNLIFGVIYAPAQDKLYVAERGLGATCNDQPLSVSKRTELSDAILASDNSGSISHRLANFSLLAQLSTKVRHVRVLGSGALHLAKIASGHIDGYFKTKYNHWDYAAGVLLIQEAGGRVSDINGESISQYAKGVVATNNSLHDQLIQQIHNH